MKKLFTSTLLTVAAVPFLVAAPNTAKKAQNQSAPADQQTAATAKAKTSKKHAKKSQSAPAANDTASPAQATPKK